MSGEVLDVRVGSRLWFDGTVWTVCRLSGATVQLTDDGRYRTVAIGKEAVIYSDNLNVPDLLITNGRIARWVEAS